MSETSEIVGLPGSPENDAPVLVRLPVESIVTNWRVGSAEWSWDAERAELADDPVTDAVRRRVLAEGIGFADAYAPVLLGSDGRVWDGHHRIVIALEQGITHLNAECVIPRGSSDPSA